MGKLFDLSIYNPAMLTDKDFKLGFVARTREFDRLLQRFEDITPQNIAQHHLILGPRGMGKTSLLRRLALGIKEDKKLGKQLLPLSFREEQYNVHNLQIFWINCLDALGDWFEKNGQDKKAEAVDRDVTRLVAEKNDLEGVEAYRVFWGWMKKEGKRPILLLDNIDLILNGLSKQQWKLRKILQKAGGIIVVGASTSYMEAAANREAAFFDFFQVTVLEKLSHPDLLACLRRLGEARGEDGKAVLKIINEDPGRIHTLYDLTGGNPRTLTLLYLLLEQDGGGDVFHDLERLLDQVTVLYKARVEDLSPQARVVLDSLALAWNPITAATLSDSTKLNTPTVSSHLKRLQNDGIIEKASISTSKRDAFQLSERFFNIWYLMRHAPRRQRTRLKWLTNFLRSFYTPKQLEDRARHLLEVADGGGDHCEQCLALSDAIDNSALSIFLRAKVEKIKNPDLRTVAEAFKDGDIVLKLEFPKTIKKWLQYWETQKSISKNFNEFMGAYQEFVKKNSDNYEAWVQLAVLENNHCQNYENAVEALQKAIKIDLDKVDAWRDLAIILHFSLNKYDEAKIAYQKVLDLKPNDADSWNHFGALMMSVSDGNVKAEEYFRKAIKINSDHFMAWGNLGNLLIELGRYEEAQKAYLKAVKIYPKEAGLWTNLGIVLAVHLKKYEEAVNAFQKSLEINPEDIENWKNIALLYRKDLKQYAKSELAYKKIIEHDPKNAGMWNDLGVVQSKYLDKDEEGEEAYKKAIEIDPKNSLFLSNLGRLFAKTKSYHEAEKAYRKIIEIDAKNVVGWGNLAVLLQNVLKKYTEAEQAYRKVLKIDSDNIQAWYHLGSLLQKDLKKDDEAMQAYKQVIAIKSKTSQDYQMQAFVWFYLFDQPQKAIKFYEEAQKIAEDDFSLYPKTNLLVLYFLEGKRDKLIERDFKDALLEYPTSGSSLLKSIDYLSQDNFGKAASYFEEALDTEDPKVFEDYMSDLILFLRESVKRGYGEKLLNYFEKEGMKERFWPVYVALDAYVYGEERLKDVNPEVRGVATSIFFWLDAPRKLAALELEEGGG